MKVKLLLKQKFIVFLGAVLVLSSICANGFNFLYNAYLGRTLDIQTFGILSLLGGILSLADIPFNALSGTVTYKSAFILGKHKKTIKEFWAYVRKRAVIISIILTILWIMLIPFLANFFDTDSYTPFILVTPVWILGFILAVDGGYLSGNLKFAIIAGMTMAEALAKLLFAFLFVQVGLKEYIYAAIPLSMVFSVSIAWLSVRRLRQMPLKKVNAVILNFPKKFFATSVFIRLSSIAYLNFDVILAKHYLSPTQAGEYALLSLSGKMIFFAGSLFSQFILPIVSRHEGAGKSTNKVFYQLLLATTGICTFAFLIVGMWGNVTIPFLFGHRASVIVIYLPLYTISMLFFTLSNSIVTFHQVKKHYAFPLVSFIIALFQVIGIISYHNNLLAIATVMEIIGGVSFLIILYLHFFYDRLVMQSRNIRDFFELFLSLPQQATKNSNGTRILIFNWRDTRHVWAGGAEIYIHELAKQWVKKGNIVTVFCGNDGNNPRYEIVDGMQIVRRGGFYTVYFWAFLYYIMKFRNRFDVIVDSENGIPFFTPLYSRVPVLLLIHHIHQEVFRNHLRWPFSVIALFIEQRLMPIVYYRKAIVTVSDSSKAEIEKIGLGKKSNISIIHPGIDLHSFVPSNKTEYPSLLYLGRLKPYKNVDIIIKSFVQVAKLHPTAKLFIVGTGEGLHSLQMLTKTLRVSQKVKFLGAISEKGKRTILAKSWIMLQPSQIEGWGITVIEANASKTPVIASNVNGLRDSVINGRTGLLVQPRNIKAFTQTIDLLLSRPFYRKMLAREAYIWAKNFSWEKSAEDFLQVAVKSVANENTFEKNIQNIKARFLQAYGHRIISIVKQ